MSSLSMVVLKGTSDLGRCLDVRRGLLARPGLVLGAGIAAIIAWVALAMWMGATVGRASGASIGLAAALILPPAFIATIWGGARVVFSVSLYENGIVKHDTRGRPVLLWSALAEVYERVDLHESSFGNEERGSFVFVAHDGTRVVVDPDVPGWLEIGRAASEIAQDRIASTYELALVGRQRVRFGKLFVDAYGIHTESASMGWNAIAFVRLDRGGPGREPSFAVHQGAWAVIARVPTYEVANARILIRVLERFGKIDVPAVAMLGDLESIVAQAA